ncbi:hypothetical protein GCM10022239_04430 [Leifsonia bigeumensis]|uniref:Uncharacterized protein n=1 Tax=Leifsonella bigeumensis TaxID=433643 RepID=A0ABP7F3U5_9MICO
MLSGRAKGVEKIAEFDLKLEATIQTIGKKNTTAMTTRPIETRMPGRRRVSIPVPGRGAEECGADAAVRGADAVAVTIPYPPSCPG